MKTVFGEPLYTSDQNITQFTFLKWQSEQNLGVF